MSVENVARVVFASFLLSEIEMKLALSDPFLKVESSLPKPTLFFFHMIFCTFFCLLLSFLPPFFDGIKENIMEPKGRVCFPSSYHLPVYTSNDFDSLAVSHHKHSSLPIFKNHDGVLIMGVNPLTRLQL